MNELQPLQAKFESLIAQLTPQKRKQLARTLGQMLATSQRQRITRQQNPDGSAFAARKQQKGHKGSIKQRAMFRQLKTTRLMKTKITADNIAIGYTGVNAHIAAVHQFGLASRVNRQANWKVKYEQRELLGFSEQDLERIENIIISALMVKSA